MADKDPTGVKTYADIDKEAVEKFNRLAKLSQEREVRLHRHFEWRGNKLPPFSIEPMSTERERLSGMTVADRAARKQWLQDQHLAVNEPVFIKELHPRNPIKRLFGLPWDVAHGLVKPVVGESMARSIRYFSPRVAGALLIFYSAYYNIKYLPNNWTEKRGWHIIQNKDHSFPGDLEYPTLPQKEHDDFFDKGFKSRHALLDVNQSSTAIN